MFKKFLIAVAVAASFVGAGSLVTATSADAAPMYRADQGQHGQWRGHGGNRGQWRGHGHRGHWRGGHGHWRGGYYRGWRGGYYGGWRGYPPGLYGYYNVYPDCWLTKRRAMVLTDYGWRLRWRTVRVCR